MEKKKEKEIKAVDEKTRLVISSDAITVNVCASGFPNNLFDIWRKECKAQCNDIYWVKMWTDRLKAQSYDLLVKSQFLMIKEEPKQEEKKEEGSLGLLNPENEEKGE